MRASLHVLLVSTVISAPACGKKDKSKSEGESAEPPTEEVKANDPAASPIKDKLAANLKANLVELGLTDVQATTISEAGKATPAALLQGEPTVEAEILEFLPPVIAILDDPGLALPVEVAIRIVGVVAETTNETLPELDPLSEIAGGKPITDRVELPGNVVGTIVGSFDDGGMGEDTVPTGLDTLIRASIGSLDATGLTADAIEGALLGVVGSGVAALPNAGISTEALQVNAGMIAESAFASLRDVDIANDPLPNLAEGISGTSMQEYSNLPGMTAELIAAGAYEIALGVLTGASKLGVLPDGSVEEIVQAASAGTMKGAGQFEGLTDKQTESVATYTMEGVMISLSSFTEFDPSRYATVANASSAGLMAGASAIANFNPEFFDDVAKGAGKGAISGAMKIDGFEVAYLDDVAQGTSAGVVEGAGGIKEFNPTLYPGLASGTTEGISFATASLDSDAVPSEVKTATIGASAAGLMVGASSIPGFDSTVLNAMASSAGEGAMKGTEGVEGLNQSFYDNMASNVSSSIQTGAANFPGMDQEGLGALKTSTSDGISQGGIDLPEGTVDLVKVADSADIGANAGAHLVEDIQACDAAGKIWNYSYNLCEEAPAAAGDSGTPLPLPGDMCTSGGGIWDQSLLRCDYPVGPGSNGTGGVGL